MLDEAPTGIKAPVRPRHSEFKLSPSKINIDITDKYIPRGRYDIAQLSALHPVDDIMLYLSGNSATHALGFNMDRSNHVFCYMNGEKNFAVMDNRDIMSLTHGGGFFEINYPAPGTFSSVSSRDSGEFIKNKDVWQGKIMDFKKSPYDNGHFLVRFKNEKEYGHADKILLADRSNKGKMIEKTLNTGWLSAVDMSINTSKYQDSNGKHKAIYAVSAESLSGDGQDQIFLFNEDGSVKEKIPQSGVKIINGSRGVFYFLTREGELGMINTAGVGETPEQSEVKFIFNQDEAKHIRTIAYGPKDNLIVGTKEGEIIAIDGQEGKVIATNQLSLAQNEDLAEMALTPAGKELFYATQTIASKPGGPTYSLKSLTINS